MRLVGEILPRTVGGRIQDLLAFFVPERSRARTANVNLRLAGMTGAVYFNKWIVVVLDFGAAELFFQESLAVFCDVV